MDFDLISDLHLDQWPKNKHINFRGLGTSLNCVVAGDVSQSLTATREFLYQLADNYELVIYVDGNHEHKNDYGSIDATYEWLDKEISRKNNITFLYDSTCIKEKTAFIGGNGWWTFDYLSPVIPRLEHITSFCEHEGLPSSVAVNIWDHAIEQVEFLSDVVEQFNASPLIENIVMVTHTVPHRGLLTNINWELQHLCKLTNSSMPDVLASDKNNKIKVWCFGHEHTVKSDQIIDGVRYVSNPRGRPDDTIFPVYYPKLITV